MITFIGMGIIGAILLCSSSIYVERSVSRVGKLATIFTFILIPLTFSNIYILFNKAVALTKRMGEELDLGVLRFSDGERMMLLVYIVCIILYFVFSSLYRRKFNNSLASDTQEDEED